MGTAGAQPSAPDSGRLDSGSAVAALTASGNEAGESSTVKAIGERLLPHLGGHRYTPSQLDLDPFITTHIRTATGMGIVFGAQTQYQTPDSSIVTLEGDLLVLLVDVEYQHAVTPWLSVRGLFTATARSGTNEQSLVGLGISSLDGLELGTKLRLWSNRNVLFSASAEFRRMKVFIVSPADYAEELVENGFKVSENGILVESSANRYTGALRCAYAPAAWLGLLGMIESGVGDQSIASADNEVVFATGITLSIDLVPLVSVPIGVLSTFLYDTYPANADDLANDQRTFALGVSYTGRDEFAVGIELARSRFALLETEESIKVNAVRAKLQYYF
jgi:hypothetical protein